MRIFSVSAAFAAALIATVPLAASAATITWEPSVNLYDGTTNQNFINNSDGTLAVAVNGTSNTESPTVNGVTFQALNQGATVTDGVTGVSVTATASGEHPNAFGDGEFTSDGDIFNLIASGLFSVTDVTISGLTIGNEYLIQYISNDSRGNRSTNFVYGLSDGNMSGVAGTAEANNSPSDGSAPTFPETDAGDSISGTFVADATSITFEVWGSTNGGASFALGAGPAQLNGLQVRDLGVAIPEPASVALLALGAVAGIARRRRV